MATKQPDDRVDLMLGELDRTDLDDRQKQQTARQLIETGGERAIQALIDKLQPDGNAATWQLILQALRATPDPPPPALAWPVFELMNHADALLTHDLAAVLGRFRNPQITQKLARIAQGRSVRTLPRHAAILALGYHHSRATAKILVGLTRNDQPPIIRQAACTALASLTFMANRDPAAWRHWWAGHRQRTDRLWHDMLLRNASEQHMQMAQQSVQIQDRLTDVQRQLYRMMSQDDRPAHLATMLGDPLKTVRQLAIDLCVQRLIDNQPIDAQLRDALLDRLGDTVVTIRRRAVTLLRDLADETAADTVAQHLAHRQEDDPTVLQAYLLMMARLPRPAVVTPALKWLNDPELAIEAAGALASAANHGLLDTRQAAQAATQARALLRQNSSPSPALIELLGQVGNEDDWQRIAGWVRSDDDAIKQTAAQVWADSHRPLHVLVEHSGDPVIQQIVISAARRRGFLPETLDALVEHKPEQDQAAQAWQSAVVAVASRVPPAAVLEVAQKLAQQGEPLELRQRVLSAAVDQLLPTHGTQERRGDRSTASHGGPPPANEWSKQELAVWMELLLARAEVWLANGDPPRAIGDYHSLETTTASMNVDQLQRYQFGMLDAQLAAQNTDLAIEWAWQMAQSASVGHDRTGVIDQMVPVFLAAAKRNTPPANVTDDQAQKTWWMLTQLQEIFEPDLPGHLLEQIQDMQNQLNPEAIKTNAPDAPDPATPNASTTSPAPRALVAPQSQPNPGG